MTPTQDRSPQEQSPPRLHPSPLALALRWTSYPVQARPPRPQSPEAGVSEPTKVLESTQLGLEWILLVRE